MQTQFDVVPVSSAVMSSKFGVEEDRLLVHSLTFKGPEDANLLAKVFEQMTYITNQAYGLSVGHLNNALIVAAQLFIILIGPVCSFLSFMFMLLVVLLFVAFLCVPFLSFSAFFFFFWFSCRVVLFLDFFFCLSPLLSLLNQCSVPFLPPCFLTVSSFSTPDSTKSTFPIPIESNSNSNPIQYNPRFAKQVWLIIIGLFVQTEQQSTLAVDPNQLVSKEDIFSQPWFVLLSIWIGLDIELHFVLIFELELKTTLNPHFSIHSNMLSLILSLLVLPPPQPIQSIPNPIQYKQVIMAQRTHDVVGSCVVALLHLLGVCCIRTPLLLSPR